MSSTGGPTDDAKHSICQTAWRALAQDRPQEAVEALAPFAEQTRDDEELARVWSAMMGWVDDIDHLERELRRLARSWAATPTVVLEMSRSISRVWSRREGPLPFAARESVVGLGVDILDVCISEAPPPKPEDRAALYRQRAALLALAGPLGDERALSDLDVALSLTPDDAAGWFQLARLHLARGRWEKSALATEQALAHGYDELRGGWNLAVALTAHAPKRPPEVRSLKAAWSLAGHEAFSEASVTDQSGREVAGGLDKILVSLHSQMVSLGGWDLEREWSSEVVWVQPLSPCHGRVIHPTITQLPADFDDLILWDPHPTRFERIEGEERPIMSALAILERGAAISRPLPRPVLDEARLRALNEALPQGVFFDQPPLDAVQTHQRGEESVSLSGKICWPRSLSAHEVMKRFEEAWRVIYDAP